MRKVSLEEIECDIKRDPAYLEPWRLNLELIRHAPRLLEIAQEQRGAATADEERTKAAAVRVWGEHVRGCDTVDAMADLIEAQRAEIAAMRKVVEISKICANEGGHDMCPRTDHHHIALMEMREAIASIGTKK